MASGVREVPLSKLRASEKNPRRISAARLEQLKRSLEADREMLRARPVVALPDGTVIMGNQRLRAAQELGWTTLPVLTVDLDDERAALWMLRDNQGYGEWDEALLSELLAELAAAEVDLDLSGFEERELVAFMASVGGGQTAPDDAPEPPEDPRSQPGEVYELGPHRLLCGDATDNNQLALLFGDEKAAAVWTDPPYAIYGSATGVSSSITDDKIVRPFFRSALAACEEWTPWFAPAFICCDWRSWPSWWEVAKSTRMEPKNLIVWDKGGSGLGNNFANTYELLGYFLHMPQQKTMTGGRKTGIRPILKPNLLRVNRPTGDDRQHNAAKPTDLIREILEVATDPGAIVLDLFAGSGSTLIACDQIDRRCFLVEIDPVYCDVIRQRYAAYVGEPDLAP